MQIPRETNVLQSPEKAIAEIDCRLGIRNGESVERRSSWKNACPKIVNANFREGLLNREDFFAVRV